MDDLYLGGIGFIDGIFLPLFFLLNLALDWVAVDTTTALGWAVLVFSWVAFLHDTDIFPLHLIATLDVFVFSGFVSLIMRLLRWIIDVIPFI